MFHLLDADERAFKAALLLAHEKYQKNYEPFVKSAARLEYARRDILSMIEDVSAEVGADSEKVAERFFEVIAEKQKMDAEGLPSGKNVKNIDGLEDIKKTDVMDRGDVEGAGLEEALNPKGLKKEDLSAESRVQAYSSSESGSLKDKETWKSCFRCSDKLNPISAQRSPVCPKCTDELKRQAAPLGTEAPADPSGPVQPVEQNQQFQCAECAKQQGTAPVVGTKEQIIEHVQQAHADLLNPAGQPGTYPTDQMGQPRSKVAEREPVEVGAESTPADKFDDYIQQIADRAAARQFSQADDEEIRAIAEQYGLEEGDVKQNLYAVATFGSFSAANGTPGEVELPEGYEEVANVGGRVESHEALIPVDTAIAKVADDMNMERDLVYNMVRDRYGADLPDKYHASISGEHKFYLPATLIGEQNDVGPSARPDVAAEEAAPVG